MSKPAPAVLQDFTKRLVDTLPEALKCIMAGQYEKLTTGVARTGYACFTVGRNVYFPGQRVVPMAQVRGNAPPLPVDFMSEFLAWEAPFKQLTNDLARITQGLASVMLRANSWQDVRNMIPDYFLRPALKGEWNLQDLERTSLDLYAGAPVAFAEPTQERLDREAIWDPRLLNMYERIGPTIDLYLGYKLL